MTAVATVGTVNGLSGELILEWGIPQFSTLSRKVDDLYNSPVFTFLGNRWCLRIIYNGESDDESEGYTGLYLYPKDITTPRTISFAFGLKSVGEDLKLRTKFAYYKFEGNKKYGCGYSRYFKNSVVTSRGNDLLPKDVLTVRCTLMNGSYDRVSLLDRLFNVSHTLVEILEGKKRTDVVLKVEGEEIKEHRVILEAKSEVFQRMFSHDMLENRTGEVQIEDVAYDVFHEVLVHMYGGIAKITPENARPLYVAADRFHLEGLQTLCVDFLKDNMSDNPFCDAFVVADMHNETVLMEVVKEYLGKNVESIIETDNWKKLVAEDSGRSIKILTTLVKLNAGKSK